MKINIKSIFTLITAYCLSAGVAQAQLDDYGWRFGAGVGNMYYYGDLSEKFDIGKVLKNHYQFDKSRDLSYSVFVERRLTPGISLALTATQGYITASDPLVGINQPTLDQRALNFRTKIQDLNAAFLFKSDNDKLLGEGFFLAPYFFVGGGITNFNVFADLKDANGNFYNYASGGVLRDDSYETEVTNLMTETDKQYQHEFIPHVSSGIGLRLRFLGRLSLHFQTDLRYAFSDHLDDVSTPDFRTDFDNELQQYANKPNLSYVGTRGKDDAWNDIYANTTLSLRISLGRKKEGFTPPIFYSSDTQMGSTESVKLVANEVKIGDTKVTIYDTIRVIQQGYQSTTDSSMLGKAQALIDSLETVKMSQRQMTTELEQSRKEYKSVLQELNATKNADETERKRVQNRLDSLQRSISELSIVAAKNIDTTKTATANPTQVDSTQLKELNKLRAEIDQLKLKKDAQINADNAADAAKAVGQTPIGNERETRRANVIAEVYHEKFQADVDTLSAQIAALTAIVAHQNKQTAAPMPPMPPTYQPYPYQPYPPYPYPYPAQQPTTTDPTAAATIQALTAQLNALNARLAALEARPQGSTTINTPAPQAPVIIQNPVAPTNNAPTTDPAMLKMIEDMRRQLDQLNQKADASKSQAPVQPTVITVEKPVIVEKTVEKPVVVEKQVIVEKPVTVTRTYETEIARLSNLSVYFDINSSVIKSADDRNLAEIAKVLKSYPQGRLNINGYTDNTGSAEYNRKLSEKRANAVRDRLVMYGVNGSQLSLNFYGKSAASSTTDQQDRRVDLQWVR
jgi:outer membrane protein OmpA-like peptidoglycan-associated protein